MPLAKVINADSFNKFTYKKENNFQTLITTEGITSAYSLSFK
jgi:predicted metalloprotease with PDZ domain